MCSFSYTSQHPPMQPPSMANPAASADIQQENVAPAGPAQPENVIPQANPAPNNANFNPAVST